MALQVCMNIPPRPLFFHSLHIVVGVQFCPATAILMENGITYGGRERVRFSYVHKPPNIVGFSPPANYSWKGVFSLSISFSAPFVTLISFTETADSVMESRLKEGYERPLSLLEQAVPAVMK